MRVLVQWTTDPATGWEEVDSANWAALPSKPDPRGGELIDAAAGWVYHLNVQGVCFTGDHYAVEHLSPGDTVSFVEAGGSIGERIVPPGGGCRVYCWSDTPGDYPPGDRNGKVYTFLPLAPDARLGGAVNTVQCVRYFCEANVAARMPARLHHGRVDDWGDFPFPAEAIARHGKWVPAALNRDHDDARELRGWREWCDHLPIAEIENGRGRPRLRDQRDAGRWSKAKGTRTYTLRDTALATGVHAAAATETEMIQRVTSVAATTSHTMSGGDDVIAYVWTTVAGEPNDAAWPTGDYRCQIDINAIGADVQCGFFQISTAAGHFARVNSGLTADSETKAQTQGAFTTTGTHLATTGSVSWSAGSAGDRFEMALAATRAANHGNQALDLDLDHASAFADGPWANELEDSIAVTDSVVAEIVTGGTLFDRSASDAVGVTDNVSADVAFDRAASDAVLVTDAVERSANYDRSALDAVAMADQIVAGLIIDREISDAVSVSDNTLRGASFERALVDLVSVADVLDRDASFDRSAADAATVSDNVAAELLGAGGQLFDRSAFDSIGITDLVSTEMTFQRSPVDAVSLVDAVTAGVTFDRAAADAISATDGATAERELDRSASDSVTVSDTVERDAVFARSLSDVALVTDLLIRGVFYVREASDTISVSDSVLGTLAGGILYDVTLADAMIVGDDVKILIPSRGFISGQFGIETAGQLTIEVD